MKFILAFLYCFFVSFLTQAQSFFPQMEDIPQMEGFTQIEEVANFDNPMERLVILTAQSNQSIDEIEKFYRQTLKNLGWKEVKKNSYQRQTDSFQLEISNQKKHSFIQMTLTQKNVN